MIMRIVMVPVLIFVVVLGLAGCRDGGPGIGSDAESQPSSGRTVVGYVPYWDQKRGFEAVRRNLGVFDEVSPFWYSLEEDGRVVPADDVHTKIDLKEVRFLQDHDIKVIPTITNLRNGKWEPSIVQHVLSDRETSTRHIQEIVDLAVSKDYDGIDIDYESLDSGDRGRFSSFLGRLGDALRSEGKLLTSSVHPKHSEPGANGFNAAQDYRAIGEAVDQVRVMTYDFHGEATPPGPVAPAEWVDQVIGWAVTQIPPKKVILGIALLGYKWSDSRVTTIGYESAKSLSRRQDVEVSRDGDQTPWFEFSSKTGNSQVWYEDAKSVEGKLELIQTHDLGGVFFWRLGGEDARLWEGLAKS